jgi:hypothetical protein
VTAPIRVDSPETPRPSPEAEKAALVKLDEALAELGIGEFDRSIIRDQVEGYATAQRQRDFSLQQQRERGMSRHIAPFS